jgi:drug/metabolite transporter, DME family
LDGSRREAVGDAFMEPSVQDDGQAPGSVGPRLQVLLTAGVFSTGSAAIKAAELSGWQVAAFRSGIAAVALVVLLPSARRRLDGRLARVALAYAATVLLYALANKLTTGAAAIFLQSTSPLYLLFLAPWLLDERVRRRDLVYMAALLAGLSMFFLDVDPASATAPDPLTGNLLALAAGVSWAFTVLGLRWLGRSGGGEEGGAAVVWGNVFAFALGLPFVLSAPGPAFAMGATDLGWLLYLGVVQIGLAYVLLTRALRRVPAFEASLLLLLEPVLNPLWTWWLHGETPGAGTFAGGALIVAATVGKALADRRG